MQWIETWAELISLKNLEILLTMDSDPVPVSKQYETAARVIRGEAPAPGIVPSRELPLWQEREERLAGTIRAELSRNKPVRSLYIGGWMHLVSRGTIRSLRDLLGIPLARCILLGRSLF
jgi:hypothetical protein